MGYQQGKAILLVPTKNYEQNGSWGDEPRIKRAGFSR